MKSPASIVNTMLESDYAEYNPNLDPFNDPKNITHADLGHAYVTQDDTLCWSYWISMLRDLGLLPPDAFDHSLSHEQKATVGSIDKVYVKLGHATIPSRGHIWPLELTQSARKRIEGVIGPPNDYGDWSVRVVEVTHK